MTTKKGIPISKALMNELTHSLRYHRAVEDVKKKWLEERAQADFERRCPDAPKPCQVEDILEQLAAKGIGSERITRSSTSPSGYYRSDKWTSLRMDHYTLWLESGQASDWKRGRYQSINAYLFQRFTCAQLAWKRPEDVADWIIALDSLLPQWETGDWEKTVRECQKKAKMDELNIRTIETLIRMKLKGTGIAFAIEEQQLRVKVYFRLEKNTQLKLYLSRKKFMEQMDAALDTVRQLYKLVQSTGLHISVKRPDKHLQWQETTEEA